MPTTAIKTNRASTKIKGMGLSHNNKNQQIRKMARATEIETIENLIRIIGRTEIQTNPNRTTKTRTN
jgi:hypothetical protein